MTEEAREAALIEIREAAERARMHADPLPTVRDVLHAGRQAIFDAGVREGIRQARSAVAAEALVYDTDDEFDVVYQSAIEDALAAIDVLEADHD